MLRSQSMKWSSSYIMNEKQSDQISYNKEHDRIHAKLKERNLEAINKWICIVNLVN